jgi:general secretion pathway protein D
MNIRPTLSRITAYVDDPGVSIIAERTGTNVKSQIPVIEVRELDSVLKISSGQVMVIGGLMKEEAVNKDAGVPGLSKMPIVGNLFKGVTKSSDVVETVIFIKATIIPSAGYVPQGDKDFYENFGAERDSRPFTF